MKDEALQFSGMLRDKTMNDKSFYTQLNETINQN